MEIDSGIVWEIPSLRESKNLKMLDIMKTVQLWRNNVFHHAVPVSLNCLLNSYNVEYLCMLHYFKILFVVLKLLVFFKFYLLFLGGRTGTLFH